jgi:hypothetical protein
MAIALNPTQTRIKMLAETTILQDKTTRVNYINEMKGLIRQLTSAQAVDLVNAINSDVALNFLIPAGIFGDAREVLYAKKMKLEGRPK